MSNARNAIVIGGGLTGLLCAKVLADQGYAVRILERSTPEVYENGSAQAPHLHVLMERGRRALEELFPGFDQKLAQAGAPEIDWAADTVWKGASGVYPRYDSQIKTRSCSRHLLERIVRHEISGLPGVTFQFGAAVANLERRGSRVEAVLLAGGEKLSASVYVNSSGRNGAQIHAARHQRVDAQIYYTSVRLAGEASRSTQYYSQYCARTKRGAVVTPIEGGEFFLTCLTRKGTAFPRNFEEMRALVASTGLDEFSALLSQTRATSEIRHYGATASEARIPTETLDNYVVAGDALVATNPTYGQGMTVAALSAQILARQIEGGTFDQKELNGVAREVFALTASEDLKLAPVRPILSAVVRAQLTARGVAQQLLFTIARRSRFFHRVFLNKLHLRNA